MNDNNEQTIIKQALDAAEAVDAASAGIYSNIVQLGIKCEGDASKFNAMYEEALDSWLKEKDGRSVPRNSTLRSALSIVRQALDWNLDLIDEDGNPISKNNLYKSLKKYKSKYLTGSKSSLPTTSTEPPKEKEEEVEMEAEEHQGIEGTIITFAQACKKILESKDALSDEYKTAIVEIAEQLINLDN